MMNCLVEVQNWMMFHCGFGMTSEHFAHGRLTFCLISAALICPHEFMFTYCIVQRE